MRAAKRAGPRQAVSRDGLVTAVRPLRTVTTSIDADRCRDLHVEAVGRKLTVRGRRLGHERSASKLARREDREFIESSDFRASMDMHGSL